MTDLPPSRFFPPAEMADADGLLALGGRLTPQWLLDAYRHGIFPWPQSDIDEPVLWWSPDPRAIIEFDRFHVSRRLAQTCRSGRFTVTCDRDFAGVIRGCATANDRVGQTWLTPRMIRAYTRLFDGTRGNWPAGSTEWQSAGCLPRNPCSTASATPRKWPWCIWSPI